MNVVKRIVKDFRSLLYTDILRRNKTTPFIIFIAFFISFTFFRVSNTFFIGKSVFFGDYHMHHFFWGLILITISNWIALVGHENLHNAAAAIFGLGVGTVTDEVGLLMTCGTFSMPCDYWARPTMYVFVSICAILLMIIYSEPVTKKFNRAAKRILKKLK